MLEGGIGTRRTLHTVHTVHTQCTQSTALHDWRTRGGGTFGGGAHQRHFRFIGGDRHLQPTTAGGRHRGRGGLGHPPCGAMGEGGGGDWAVAVPGAPRCRGLWGGPEELEGVGGTSYRSDLSWGGSPLLKDRGGDQWLAILLATGKNG